MNHKQDIDDGLDEHRGEALRIEDEARFSQDPQTRGFFNGTVNGESFTCTDVVEIHLNGFRTKLRTDPLSYESGFARLHGYLNVNEDIAHLLPGITVDVRWRNHTLLDAALLGVRD